MNFFAEQDHARRNTKVLVILFVAAVAILIAITNLIVGLTLWLMGEQLAGNYNAYQDAVQTLNYNSTSGLAAYFNWSRVLTVSVAVSSVIGCAIAYKWFQLSGGGKRVAEQLGGQRIHPNTDNPSEKRVLNVVEEMALAANMPVPAVYLLDKEIGINAFAAGVTPADAVIGVTRGCLDQFNREQLQGVIAHEFSHILNGDMRLNIRLIALLNGIIFVGLMGELIMRAGGHGRRSFGSRRSNNGRIALFGLALVAVGWLGRFFGNWIRSAVSRQREFLADASAVQFTRNPQGIADALKIIGGYQASASIQAANVGEVSHLFFGQALTSKFSMFATHPPLGLRIIKVDPQWDGQYIFREVKETDSKVASQGTRPTSQTQAISGFTDASAKSVAGQETIAQTASTVLHPLSQLDLPEALLQHIHEPLDAVALMFAILLSENDEIQTKQLSFVQLSAFPGIDTMVQDSFLNLKAIDNALLLPIIEMSLPALKCMSDKQYRSFCKTLLLLIRADGKTDLHEWCLYQLVRHFLDAEFGVEKPSRAKFKHVSEVANEFQLVLSLMAYQGNADAGEREKAFHRGANTAGIYTLSLMNEKDFTMELFVQAVNTLASCYPLLKPKLLKSLVDCAKMDNHIANKEAQLITAIAAVMDCPTPSLDI